MRFIESLRATYLATILFCAIGCSAQLSNASSDSNLSSKRHDIHCAAGVCTANIDPASFFPNVQFDLTHRGVNLSRPHLMRNPGKWEGVLAERTCYTMRSYLMAREDRHSDSTRQVGYSVCEPSSTFDVRETVESQNTVTR